MDRAWPRPRRCGRVPRWRWRRLVRRLGRRTLRDSPLLHPIRARILADLGDLPGARAELVLSPPGTAETLASQWYVAELAGQDSTTWADAWEQTPHPPGRTLDQLRPLENE